MYKGKAIRGRFHQYFFPRLGFFSLKNSMNLLVYANGKRIRQILGLKFGEFGAVLEEIVGAIE
jgi:hypothetical protein